MTNLNWTVLAQTIERLLQREENVSVANRGDIGASMLRRKEIEAGIAQLENATSELVRRERRLPQLPNEAIMNWAEAVLSMRNMSIVVLDTTGVRDDSDILRIYAINSQGEEIIDQIVRPERQMDANTAYTGISQQEIENAPNLTKVWEFIQATLKGRYCISFNFKFVEGRLKENIEHYGLARLSFLGDCLMEKAHAYFNIRMYSTGLKLPEACLRIGHQIPSSPPQAASRAAACLALLKAMSQGVMSVPSNANTDLDEHPF